MRIQCITLAPLTLLFKLQNTQVPGNSGQTFTTTWELVGRTELVDIGTGSVVLQPGGTVDGTAFTWNRVVSEAEVLSTHTTNSQSSQPHVTTGPTLTTDPLEVTWYPTWGTYIGPAEVHGTTQSTKTTTWSQAFVEVVNANTTVYHEEPICSMKLSQASATQLSVRPQVLGTSFDDCIGEYELALTAVDDCHNTTATATFRVFEDAPVAAISCMTANNAAQGAADCSTVYFGTTEFPEVSATKPATCHY